MGKKDNSKKPKNHKKTDGAEAKEAGWTKPGEFSTEDKKTIRKARIVVYIFVLFLFIGIISITYIFEYQFGKTAGTIAMAVVAAGLAIYLYKDEIKKKIKKYRNK